MEKIFDFLIEKGVDPLQNREGYRALFALVENGYPEDARPLQINIINKLLDKGLNINEVKEYIGYGGRKEFRTLIMLAVENTIDICRLLLKRGAKLDFTHCLDHTTAISRALFLNRNELAQELISHAIELEKKGECNIAAAFGPSLHGMLGPNQLRSKPSEKYFADIQKLIDQKADINARDRFEDTPLHDLVEPFTIRCFTEETLKTILTQFLTAGADVSLKNKRDREFTVMDVALEFGPRYGTAALSAFVVDFINSWNYNSKKKPVLTDTFGTLFSSAKDFSKPLISIVDEYATDYKRTDGSLVSYNFEKTALIKETLEDVLKVGKWHQDRVITKIDEYARDDDRVDIARGPYRMS